MSLSLIVAMSQNRVIGHEGDLPWKLSSDLKRFKSITMGHAIIMGRKTYDSIGRLLPGRTTVIVTRQQDFDVPGATIVHSLGEAIQATAGDEEAFVTGGSEIFAAAMDKVDKIYLTLVLHDVHGDCFFPEFDESQWEILSSENIKQDAKNQYATQFIVYQRK